MSGVNEAEVHSETHADPTWTATSDHKACCASWRRLALCKRREPWIGLTLGLSHKTLRFNEVAKELGYLKECQRGLLSSMGVISSIALTFLILFAALITSDLAFDKYPTDTGRLCNRLRLQMLVVATLVALLVLFVTQCPACHKRLSEPVIESGLVAALVCFTVLAYVVSDLYVLPKLINSSPEETWGNVHLTDTGLYLVQIGIVTATHLALPIRWHQLLWVQLFSVGPFFVRIAVFGSAEQDPWLSFSMFIGIVVAASFGKRSSDLGARQKFAEILSEKTRRFAAEFQLSRQVEKNEIPNRKIAASNPSCGSETKSDVSMPQSLQTSTATGRVFNAFYEDSSHKKSLFMALRELGTQEHWLISPEEVRLIPRRRLGRGGFGVVALGEFCGAAVAVKMPVNGVKQAQLDKVRLPELANELRVLRHGRHPNLVQLYGAVIDADMCRLGLVIELVHGCSVDVFVLDRRVQTPVNHCQIILGVCNALWYLHSRVPLVVHGDLKGNNVMIEERSGHVQPKLLDFGLAQILIGKTRPMSGTLAWMAPEVFQRRGARPKKSADVFSFGRLMFFVITGAHPFDDKDTQNTMRMLSTGQFPTLRWPAKCYLQRWCAPLVEACIQFHESRRPSIDTLHSSIIAWPIFKELVSESQSFATIFPLGGVTWEEGTSTLRKEASRELFTRKGFPLNPPMPQAGSRTPGGKPGTISQASTTQLPASSEIEKLTKQPVPVQSKDSVASPSPGHRGALCTRAEDPSAKFTFMFPKLPKITTFPAREFTLVDAMFRWNFEIPPGSCCEFHAGVHLLQQISDHWMNRTPCKQMSGIQALAQCSECGLVVSDTIDDSARSLSFAKCEYCSVGTSNSVAYSEVGPPHIGSPQVKKEHGALGNQSFDL